MSEKIYDYDPKYTDDTGKFSYLNAMLVHWFTAILLILTVIGIMQSLNAGSTAGVGGSIIWAAILAYLALVRWPNNTRRLK